MKPSRIVKPGEVIFIDRDIAIRQAKVLDIPDKRVAAKGVDRYREDQTPPAPPRDKFAFLEGSNPSPENRSRMDKKQRRALRSFLKGE